ncbi:putative glycosyltransferase [Hibiscus syriacus]|uniref:Glycosyltransferase n=1 Tax=Hibiscus syriacus TaxID=106335 RepID=A0A6A3B479_HIBSY|nr:glycosyltransferase BC10-like [Hibiscus syriacus]KAE8710487.1 putative glycosyltransferase [Hibiscus syriacus]
MLSPTPLSLFCAVLLCFPLAVIITITSPTTTVPGGTGDDSIPNLVPPSVSHQRFSSKPLNLPLHDEDSLLRVASRVNSKLPPGSLKKIAFLYLTMSPLPFAPLWEVYLNQTPKNLFNVYLHADPSYPYHPPFSGVFAHRVIPSKPALRFTPTLASAARRLLAHALLHDRSNYMFVLLSANCIPIHSFNFTYETLTRSKKSFIEILKNEVGSFDRWAARGQDAMLPVVKLEDFRIGSQFWSLTRKHARLVVGDEMVWARFNQPCVVWDTCYPEENYFPTLLHMRDPRGVVPVTLTHVDWNGSFDGHPRMYVESEITRQLISRLRNDKPRYGDDGTKGSDSPITQGRHFPFLFARKFSPESVLPLLKIASDFIFKD